MAHVLEPDTLQYAKEFQSNTKISAHDINIRELMLYGEPSYKRNSGEFYVNGCLDHFKEQMLNPEVTSPISKGNSHSLSSPLIAYAKDMYDRASNKIDLKYIPRIKDKKQKMRLPRMHW